jgi:hypothetical protein
MAAGLHLGNFWPWISPTHLKCVPFQPGQVGFQVSQVETAFQEVSITEGNCVCAPETLPGLQHAHSSPWYISYLSYLRRLVETSGSQKHVAEKPIYQKSNAWGYAYLQTWKMDDMKRSQPTRCQSSGSAHKVSLLGVIALVVFQDGSGCLASCALPKMSFHARILALSMAIPC